MRSLASRNDLRKYWEHFTGNDGCTRVLRYPEYALRKSLSCRLVIHGAVKYSDLRHDTLAQAAGGIKR